MKYGTLPMSDLAPLDYRYALDAAITLFPPHTTPRVHCNIAALKGEVRHRFHPWNNTASGPPAALWVEPMRGSWQEEIHTLLSPSHGATLGAALVVIASRPMARLLPECQEWGNQEALGFSPFGISRLRRGLQQAGWHIEQEFGIHSLPSVLLNTLSLRVAPHRPSLGDRLHFAARLYYCTTGPLMMGSTVALLSCRYGGGAGEITDEWK
jgi:hypothetical protein